jgi:hypothetical protein
MIFARLVGDDAVLAWLRAGPDAVASGLGRAITRLGIELQDRVRGPQVTKESPNPAIGSSQSSADLRIEIDSDRISARVIIDGGHRLDLKGKLNRIKSGLSRPISEKRATWTLFQPRRDDVSRKSFLSTALEEMDPAVRDEVEAALREVLTRK